MAHFNSAGFRGFVLGLILGVVILAAAESEIFGDGGAIIQFLVAIPPFYVSALTTAPEVMQSILFVIWWGCIGFLVGWGAQRGTKRKVFIVLLLIAVAIGHAVTRSTIEQKLSGISDVFKGLVLTIFGQ